MYDCKSNFLYDSSFSLILPGIETRIEHVQRILRHPSRTFEDRRQGARVLLRTTKGYGVNRNRLVIFLFFFNMSRF